MTVDLPVPRAPRCRAAGRSAFGLVAILGAAPLGLGSAAAQDPAPPEVTLVRCVAERSRPCFTTSVDLAPEVARRAAMFPAESLASAWKARLLADTGLAGRGARGRTGAGRDNRLLVLVDISGTMRNLGIGTVRLALQDFLTTFDSLPPGSVRVAVAPFGSVGVANRIAAAVFTTPDSARLAVDALPTPDRENTGLYSAVELGMGRLAAELQSSESAGLGVLMLVTDGTENDVGRPGDDPGLLAGPEGLRRASRAVDQSGMVAAIIGIGAGDQGTLAALAGARGRKYLVGLDAYQLGTAFREIRDLFWSSWDLAFPLQGSREGLGRGFAILTPHLALSGEAGMVAPAVWRPPVVALPAFAGAAPEALVPAGTAGEGAGFVLDRRIPLALMVLVLSALLWFVVPRMLWPPLVVAAAEPAAPSRPAKAVPVAVGGLRTDVKEVAPRRPTDVTAAKARRAR